MRIGARAASIESTEKLLDLIEEAILTAHVLKRPFLAHLLGMAFWEARLNGDKELELHRRESMQ